MASTMVHTQSPKAMESLGFGSPFGRRSRLSLVDVWVSLPSLRPVRTVTTTTTTTTAASFTGSSGTPKGSQCCALSLEISECEELTRDAGCETPKDTDHQIPDVDVEICPPAPKKARGVSRMAMACSSAYEKPSQQDLGLSPCYLF